MQPLYILLYPFIINILRYVQAVNCPPSFNYRMHNICAVLINRTVDFCTANTICHEMGLQYTLRTSLIGMNVTKIIGNLSKVPPTFTSINKLLGNENTLRKGWYVGVPGYASYITQGPDDELWHQTQPNQANELITVISGGKLHDVSQSRQFAGFLCERVGDSNDLLNRSGTEKFSATFPKRLNSFYFPDNQNEGCVNEVEVKTLIECAKLCKLEIRCRSIYYNNVIKKCIMILFVDSLISSNYRPQSKSIWVRYARPNW
ncbi:hypothetical protein D915_006494 [Fasciola hepatica]|uniref:Apple domain-containing protein n=1 Tax=Fasciola hepatica TaxID=6192 RepID=A0A4E0R557_FASHE|nr:hypothetical protein D915_006494 [Fasciola hepatica]